MALVNQEKPVASIIRGHFRGIVADCSRIPSAFSLVIIDICSQFVASSLVFSHFWGDRSYLQRKVTSANGKMRMKDS